MSSVAKVNLLSELSYLTLKRYIQSKPDNCQEAAQEYVAELRKLYLANLDEHHQRLRAQKLSAESDIFKLEHAGTRLNGIAIDRNSLPSAELNDRVVLIRQDEEHSEAPMVKGVIVGVTDQRIRIKFDEAIFEPKQDEAIASTANKPTKSDEPADPKASDEEKNKEASQPANQEEEQKKTPIKFMIRFDSDSARKSDSLKSASNSRPHWTKIHSESIEASLANFERLKCNQTIRRTLLGFYDERNDTISDKARVMTFTEIIPKLNPQQRAAVQQALMKRLTLIEGPAGTGKTVVAAHIAANVGRQGRGRVLVCSLIGNTIDKLTEMISSVGGCRVVKLPESDFTDQGRDQAKVRKRDSYLQAETKQANHCHLDKLVDDEIYLQTYSRFKQSLGSNHEKLHAYALKMVNNYSGLRRRELETKVISKADVVCCQLNGLSYSLLKGIQFDMLIIDDVQVTSELDCLTAIMIKGIKQVVLLSDTRRDIRLARIPKRSQSMSPTSNGLGNMKRGDPDAVDRSSPSRKKRSDTMGRSRPGSRLSENMVIRNQRSGTTQSKPSLEPGELFERLVSIGLPTVDMRVQYRCHATVSNFFIHHFYASRLKDDPDTNDKMSTEIVTGLRVQENNFLWLPNKKYLTAVYRADRTGAKPSDSNDQSGKRLNAVEQTLEELVERISSEKNVKTGNYRVGIIYNNQDAASVRRVEWARAKIGTVDKFIGQEEDFIILVASESTQRRFSETAQIGLSSKIPLDFRRVDTVLNWVLTRARLGLFIVLEESVDGSETSDKETCRSWRELIEYYASNDLIVDGFGNETHKE